MHEGGTKVARRCTKVARRLHGGARWLHGGCTGVAGVRAEVTQGFRKSAVEIPSKAAGGWLLPGKPSKSSKNSRKQARRPERTQKKLQCSCGSFSAIARPFWGFAHSVRVFPFLAHFLSGLRPQTRHIGQSFCELDLLRDCRQTV